MMMKRCIRRTLLNGAILCVIAAALCSCVSVPGNSSAQQPFTFVQICDTQLGMGGYQHDLDSFKQAVKQINAIKPDFVVICGDLVGRPQKHTFSDFDAIKSQLAVPCYCVPGNHDVGNTPTLESLVRYRKEVGKDYYSFTHNGYRFVCVNTEIWNSPVKGETEKQDAWLKTTLKAAVKAQSPVFIIGHHPLYITHPDEGDGYYNLPSVKRKALLDLFEASGVVAVLTGHTHRIVINEYKGIQLVTGEATSKTLGSPLGFRLWHVSELRPFRNDSVRLEGF